jgi:hypothetical protein
MLLVLRNKNAFKPRYVTTSVITPYSCTCSDLFVHSRLSLSLYRGFLASLKLLRVPEEYFSTTIHILEVLHDTLRPRISAEEMVH